MCVDVCVYLVVCVCAGMSIILGVIEGEVFVNDAEIQKSALQVRGSSPCRLLPLQATVVQPRCH